MSYNIKLDVFEGPLDLLLHLIKENEVEIYDIPIALITEQYLEYLDVLKALNLEIAGDYLVMASTLTYIKSKTLLPKHEQEDEEPEDGIDPREELVARLVEYKKFKEAAMRFRAREEEQSRVFSREATDEDLPDGADLLLEVNMLELLKAFKRVLDNYTGEKELSVTLEEISVTDKLNEIMARMESIDHITFDALFGVVKTRMEVIATFLALLELIRLKLIRVNQSRAGGEILIYKTVENGDTPQDNPDQPGPGRQTQDDKNMETEDGS